MTEDERSTLLAFHVEASNPLHSVRAGLAIDTLLILTKLALEAEQENYNTTPQEKL